MLKVDRIKNESSILGLKVSILVDTLRDCDSLHTFQSNFESEVKKIKTGNNLRAEYLYKTKIKNEYTNNQELVIYKEHESKGTQVIFLITK